MNVMCYVREQAGLTVTLCLCNPIAYWISGPLKVYPRYFWKFTNRCLMSVQKLVCHQQSLFGALPALTSLSSFLSQLFFILSIYICKRHLSMFFILEKPSQVLIHSIFSNCLLSTYCVPSPVLGSGATE